MRPPDRRAVTFSELRAKYSRTVPQACEAKTVGHLVDRIVRQRLYEAPRSDYGTVLREVLAEDEDLREAYACS